MRQTNLLTLSQIAIQTGYEHSWLRRECALGKLQAFKLSKTWLVRPSDLDVFMKSKTRRKGYPDGRD